jgi:CPA2 family monovalent cation:H+ antiporter-2
MHDYFIIKDLVIILLVSVPIILLFNKIRMPSIVGFLIAGMLIGPFGFKLITSIEEIEIMAEVGVILLLFTIGLEVSLKELVKVKKLLFVGGGLQVVFTIFLSALFFYFLDVPVQQSVFFGMLISLSSTAIVLKLLSDKDDLETPQGKISLGILIFQDLAIVPMLLLVDTFGSGETVSFLSIISRIGVAVGVVAVILIAAKYLTPKILYYLARSRSRELFTIGVLLFLLGIAYLTFSFGLSFALGAFIAGLILSESEYTPQIFSDILPFRDAFNSIFFVSVGLLLNMGFVFNNPIAVAVSAGGIIILKFLIIFVIVLLLKYPARVAILTGLGLAQIGEFSFILAQQGIDTGLMGNYSDLFISSTIFTMILTPFLIKISPQIADKSRLITTGKKDGHLTEKLSGHVIIGGFGMNGKNLAKVLSETGISYIAIEMNTDTVKAERQKGENIIYGDISRKEVLEKAMIGTAKVLVIAISDRAISKRIITLANSLNEEIFVIVRTRFFSQTEELIKLGANDVIPEEFETSIQIFRKVLEQYHIPLNVILQQIALLRGESYRWMRSEKPSTDVFTHLEQLLAAGITDTFYINDNNSNIDKTLGEINFRAKTDATIIAIVREGKTISNPAAQDKLLANDTVVITGTHKAVDQAFQLLSE